MYKFQVSAWKKLVFLLLLSAFAVTGRAQIYPVQLSTLVSPPYSIYLPDYASPGGEKLRLVLLQRDLTVQGYRVRFEMKVQVNGVTIMQTSRSAMPPPITLQPGIPTVLGGSELSWYVQPQNLEFGGGYSSSTYEQSRSLPEGPISITFTAYDYTRSDLQVSASAGSFFYATRDNPPLLNYPACGMQVTPISPQFLNFSWLPQNTSSPNSALQTNYVFSLWAVLPAGYNFQDIVQSTRPLYSVTTQMPTLVYGPGQPPLVPGQSYAWRVQAVDITGRGVFRNSGYSETCNFNYVGDSGQGIVSYPAIQINAASAGPAQGKVWWTAGGGYDQYRLYYRKVQGNYDWFPVDVNDSIYRVFDLEPSTTYECRLQGHKNGSYGPYTDVINFTTDAPKTIGCTDNTSMLNPYSGRPLAVATSGMNITYGPWDVQLLTVQALGQPGQFKGTCKVAVPFMGAMTFNAKFDRLTIDDSRNVSAGTIDFLSQGIQAWVDSSIKNQMGGSLYGNVVSGTDTTNVTVPASLANLDHLDVALDGDSAITSFTIPGTPPTVVTVNDAMEEVTIKDAGGSTYSLDNQGNLTQLTLADGSLQDFFANPQNVAELNTLAGGVGTVTFKDIPDAKFAFDDWKPFYGQASTILTGQYEKLAGPNGDYYVPQKAIGAGESDLVGLDIDLPDNMDEDSLIFATSTGTRLIWDPNDYTLNLLGGPAADAQEIYALYPKPGGGYYSLAKLLVSAYEHKDFTAVLVPVAAGHEAAPQVDPQQYEDALNKIYNKVNISWKVESDAAYTNTGWDVNEDGLLTMTGSSFLSNKLTGEPAALIKGYKNKASVDNNKKYIFVLNTSSGSTGEAGGLLGDMPRATQYGFVFLKASSDAGEDPRVSLAHELGHGQFNLEHTFSGDIALSIQATKAYPNLMDYSVGDNLRLYKYQWSQVHQPGEVLGILESDTAGKSVTLTDISQLAKYKNSQNGLTFINPAGKRISLPYDKLQKVVLSTGDQWVSAASNQPTNVFTAIGVLQSFTLKGESGTTEYNGLGSLSDFNGYYNNGNAYKDDITAKLGVPSTNPNDNISFLGIPYYSGNQFLLNVSTIQVKNSYSEEANLSNKYIGFVDNITFLSDFLTNSASLTVGDQNIQVVPNIVHDFALSYLKSNLGSSSSQLIRSIQVWRNAMLMDKYSAISGDCIVPNDNFVQAIKGADMTDGGTSLYFPINDAANIPSLGQLNSDYFTLSQNLSHLNGFYTNPDSAVDALITSNGLINFLKKNSLECIYGKLSLKTRLKLLQNVASIKDNIEIFFRLISSMPDTDAPAFLSSLSEANYTLLIQFLNSYAGGNTQFTRLQTYFYTPISTLIQKYLQKPAPDAAPTPTNSGSVQTSNALVVDFNTPASLMSNVGPDGSEVVLNSIWLGFDGLRTNKLKLFDFVTVYLLSDVTLPDGSMLKSGQNFEITAFEAICIADAMLEKDRESAQRFMIDVLMLAAPIKTAPGTLNAIIRTIDIAGKAVALVDIGIQANKDLIASSFNGEGKAVLTAWNDLYTAVQVAQMTGGAVQLTRAVTTGVIEFCTNGAEVFGNASQEGSFLQALRAVYKDKADNIMASLKQNYLALRLLLAGSADEVNISLLQELEWLNFSEGGAPGTYKYYVSQNKITLAKNYKTIWAMSNGGNRGKLVEALMAELDYPISEWRNVGSLNGGTQELVDFYHTNDQLLVQLKSFNSTDPAYIAKTLKYFKEEVIDKLADVSERGIFMLDNGTSIQVQAVRLDIAVPKGFDENLLNSLVNYDVRVRVVFIQK